MTALLSYLTSLDAPVVVGWAVVIVAALLMLPGLIVRLGAKEES